MKNLLFVLFLIVPLLVSSQNEADQKRAIRNQSNSLPSTTPSQSSQQFNSGFPTPTFEFEQKNFERNRRNRPQIYNNEKRYYYNPGFNDWGWGWNRWQGWGAPYVGYSYWTPYFWYDNWGFRQPARIYHRDGGKVDTIKGKKINVTIGIQGNKRELGGFVTVGRETYIIAEYQRNFERDQSTYYPELTKDIVIPWGDKQLKDITKGGTFYLGAGRRYGKVGIHGQLGISTERVRFQYFDELFILSNNGKYSFPSYKDTYITAKVGTLYNFKKVSAKVDYELLRKLITLGVGVNL